MMTHNLIRLGANDSLMNLKHQWKALLAPKGTIVYLTILPEAMRRYMYVFDSNENGIIVGTVKERRSANLQYFELPATYDKFKWDTIDPIFH